MLSGHDKRCRPYGANGFAPPFFYKHVAPTALRARSASTLSRYKRWAINDRTQRLKSGKEARLPFRAI